MEYSVLNNKDLTNAFWENYTTLWYNVHNQNPFYAPNYIKRECSQFDAYFYAAWHHKQLMALVPLKNLQGTYRLLPDDRADNNTILFHKELSEVQIEEFCFHFLQFVTGKKTFLQNLPQWDESIQKIQAFLAKQKNLDYTSFEAWDCPTVEYPVKNTLSFEEWMYKTFNKKNLRNYHNRLQKREGYQFEIFEKKESQFDDWVNEFFDNHEARWNITSTPSTFRITEHRNLLKKQLEDWHEDKVLNRFSIKIEGRRIAMAICLKQNDRLIYHSIAYAPDYNDTRASSILIMLIGKWMLNYNFRIFDFGTGGEGYKFQFANHNKKLLRVYLSPTAINTFTVKAKLDRFIRTSEKSQELWDRYINNFIRGELLRKIQKGRLFLRRNKKEFVLAPKQFLKKKLLARFEPETEHFYISKGKEEVILKPSLEFRKAKVQEVLELLEQELHITPETRAFYIQDIYQQKRKPYLFLLEGKIVQISWLKIAEKSEIPPDLLSQVEEEKIYSIVDCYTPEKERGNGYYPLMLATLTSIDPKAFYLIYTHTWNTASQRGIKKAGFEYIAKRCKNTHRIEWSNDYQQIKNINYNTEA